MIKRILFLVVAASLSGCTTDPVTGQTHWDADTTLRAVGAAVGAIQQKPTTVAEPVYP